jgi:hypothetical protein
MDRRSFKILFTFSIIFILIAGFGSVKKRKFEVRFHLNDIQSFAPSCQMAVWLENIDSSLVKTLFLSEYLSYGGYNEREICYDWSSKAKWEDVTKEEFDAVTSATPGVGDVVLKLECDESLIPEGRYIINVEVHLVNEYNELYSGELVVSGRKSSSRLPVRYIPDKYPKKTEGDLLENVIVTSK